MKKKPLITNEALDRAHHQLAEQIARVLVDEEKERMEAEMEITKQINDHWN